MSIPPAPVDLRGRAPDGDILEMTELILIFAVLIALVLNERMGRKQDPPDDDEDPPLGIGGNL